MYLFIILVKRCSTSLSAPDNGNVSCSDATEVGSRCSYFCSDGFRLKGGTEVRTCRRRYKSASWSGKAPSCISKLYSGTVFLFRVITLSRPSGYWVQTLFLHRN